MPRYGAQKPTKRVHVPGNSADADATAEILHIGGIDLDEWQKLILGDWMARTSSGLWSAPTAGGSVPRQNGKTLIIQARCIGGMLRLKESIIYTAHLQKTATETFEEMRAFFENPHFTRYVKTIRNALGREQIILKNGGRIKFLARTRSGGRGQHGSLLIFDEAQLLDAAQQASFLPAISASGNPQTIYIGTPPEPENPETVFKIIRARALEKQTKKTAWFEFSVDEIGDLDDKKRWRATNPALGRRILMSTILSEREQMDDDTFARERLGWWVPETVEKFEPAIDPATWEACASTELKPEGKTAYGVKFTANGQDVYLCGAVCPAKGKARIALIETRPTSQGITWLAQWLRERASIGCAVAIDGRNGTEVLISKIRDKWIYKGSVINVTARDAVAATTTLMNELNERTVTWYKPQEALNIAAATTVRRPLAGGWTFGGEDSPALEAAALALWACRNSKRDPTRKMRVG